MTSCHPNDYRKESIIFEILSGHGINQVRTQPSKRLKKGISEIPVLIGDGEPSIFS